jgi:hypothetical protein
MEETKTERPIEYTSWPTQQNQKFLLLPISGFHTLLDLEAARKWIRTTRNSYNVTIEWQVSPLIVPVEEGLMVRTQSLKSNNIGKRGEYRWVEAIFEGNRVTIEREVDGRVVLRLETSENGVKIDFKEMFDVILSKAKNNGIYHYKK